MSTQDEDMKKEYSRGFPNAKVYTFEPVPKNFKRIGENLERFHAERIKTYQVALSDENGKATFHVSSKDDATMGDAWDSGNKSSSLMPPDEHEKLFPSIKFATQIEVETKTLASFCHEEGLDSIDFIHLDVQGAEIKVLSGAGQILQNVKIIWMEVSNVSLYKNQPLKQDIETFMENAGFFLKKDGVGKLYGDQLWLNSSRFQT